MMSHRTDMSGHERAALNLDDADARLESCDRPIVLDPPPPPTSLELCLSSRSFWKIGNISRESIWFTFWLERLWLAPPVNNFFDYDKNNLFILNMIKKIPK